MSSELHEVLLPIDALLQDFPSITISDDQADSLLQGRPTNADGLKTDGLSRFYRPGKRLFGLGETSPDGLLKTHKMFVET